MFGKKSSLLFATSALEGGRGYGGRRLRSIDGIFVVVPKMRKVVQGGLGYRFFFPKVL